MLPLRFFSVGRTMSHTEQNSAWHRTRQRVDVPKYLLPDLPELTEVDNSTLQPLLWRKILSLGTISILQENSTTSIGSSPKNVGEVHLF